MPGLLIFAAVIGMTPIFHHTKPHTDMPFPPARDPGFPSAPERGIFQFTRAGLVILCIALVSTTALISHTALARSTVAVPAAPDHLVITSSTPSSPWGELVTGDIFIEQPDEYVSLEKDANHPIRWVYPDRKPGEVRALMSAAGMTAAQITAALDPACIEVTANATLVNPTAGVVLGLSPQVRSTLYELMAEWPANKHMIEPYHLDENDLDARFSSGGVPAEAVAMVKKLIYHRRGNAYFSDVELVLHGLPDDATRVRFLKVLSGQPAVLAGLRLRADSDIDKLVGYWGKVPGVRTTDLRPLLESVARSPGGGTLNILHLLPAFARERLFTFPLPDQAGVPVNDCHWTALNFFNAIPDPRLQDVAYASDHVKENYFQIGQPSMIGDLIFLLNDADGVIHSAVYIAGDVVFTKNGVNFGQPWILMRMPDLLNVYTRDVAPKVQYYRRKDA